MLLTKRLTEPAGDKYRSNVGPGSLFTTLSPTASVRLFFSPLQHPRLPCSHLSVCHLSSPIPSALRCRLPGCIPLSLVCAPSWRPRHSDASVALHLTPPLCPVPALFAS